MEIQNTQEYQAIETKFLGPTNTLSARIKAFAQCGAVVVNWNHALGVSENHKAAAAALVEKFGWGGRWYFGASPKGDGCVFVRG